MGNSWGNLFQARQRRFEPLWRTDPLPVSNLSLLAVGNKRSYGDVCINDGGAVIGVDNLRRFVSFDENAGIIRCESGLTLWEVARLVFPRGWFLPVTPGTSFVTVGGALANDVHGKNHHVAGSFGRFVRGFGLRRSTGEVLECSPANNSEMFAATIGGCGLTGLVTWVEFSLKKIGNPNLRVESIPYASYSEFLRLSAQSGDSHEYCVSWIDCLASGKQAGAGVFFRANHVNEPGELSNALHRSAISIPAIVGKSWPLVNKLSLRVFNKLYKKAHSKRKTGIEPCGKFFYPLDSLLHWNRIYGRNGFYQFQCVVPFSGSNAITELLSRINASGQGSFLSVLKTMGDLPSPGLMSFSRPGVTLALDFPNHGKKTKALLKVLEAVVVEADGAIYPAKDALMSADSFEQFYPGHREFRNCLDPAFSSSFWRRVNRV